MMTPIGNPQNLYLYMSRGLALGDFVQTLLPYALVSYILLALGTLLLPAQRRETAQESAPALVRDRLVLYLVLLAVCLLSVLKVLPAWVAAGGGGPGRGAPSARFTGQGRLGAAGYVPVLLYLRG